MSSFSLSAERFEATGEGLFELADRCEQLALNLPDLLHQPEWPLNLHHALGQLDARLQQVMKDADIEL